MAPGGQQPFTDKSKKGGDVKVLMMVPGLGFIGALLVSAAGPLAMLASMPFVPQPFSGLLQMCAMALAVIGA